MVCWYESLGNPRKAAGQEGTNGQVDRQWRVSASREQSGPLILPRTTREIRDLDHVYSTALRLVGGDAHLAEDVAQAVFTDLACKAGSLRKHFTLSGWLHTSTRFAAANVVRTEQRRRQREQTALSMSATDQVPEPDWQQFRAFLDESIGPSCVLNSVRYPHGASPTDGFNQHRWLRDWFSQECITVLDRQQQAVRFSSMQAPTFMCLCLKR